MCYPCPVYLAKGIGNIVCYPCQVISQGVGVQMEKKMSLSFETNEILYHYRNGDIYFLFQEDKMLALIRS